MKGPSRISSSSRCFSFGMLYLWNKSKLGQWPSCWFFRDALLWPSRLSWETVSPCGIFEVSQLQTDNYKIILVVHWMNQNTSNNWIQISQVVFYTNLPASEIESKRISNPQANEIAMMIIALKGPATPARALSRPTNGIVLTSTLPFTVSQLAALRVCLKSVGDQYCCVSNTDDRMTTCRRTCAVVEIRRTN